MKTWHWIALAGVAGLAVWYFWPKQPAVKDNRQTAFGAATAAAAGIAGTIGAALGGTI